MHIADLRDGNPVQFLRQRRNRQNEAPDAHVIELAIAIPVRLSVKTGGNIAPVNRRNSRRLQAGACTERSTLIGAARVTRTIFCPSRMGVRASAISESSPRR